MPSYKIIYFNGRGRAEVSRLLFVLAGQDFVDERLDQDQWKELKPKTLLGQMPLLEVDGKQFCQSSAMAAFLAKEFGYYGKTNLDGFHIDEIMGIINDFLAQVVKVMFAEESKKAELTKEFKENQAPKFLKAFAQRLKESGTGYFVGSSVTLADIAVYDLLYSMCERFEGLLADFPTLKELVDKIGGMDKIKAHVAARKPTPF